MDPKKRTLITGPEAFIGLTELLARESAHVRALWKYNSFSDWGGLENLPCLAGIKVVTGDICDTHQCLNFVQGLDVVQYRPHSFRYFIHTARLPVIWKPT